jgi:hypothetical protein
MTLPLNESIHDPYVSFHNRNPSDFGVPCRDVSWHPYYPIIASTSFD